MRRAEKWKGRCKELRAQLEAANRAAAEQAATVHSLQQRVEDLAAAGTQLESVLHDTAQQLTQALRTAGELQANLQQEQEQYAEVGRSYRSAFSCMAWHTVVCLYMPCSMQQIPLYPHLVFLAG